MKIVGVAACTVGIAHTYMAQKAIQDECAARGIECKVEAQGGAYRTKCVSTLGASAQVDAPFSAV